MKRFLTLFSLLLVNFAICAQNCQVDYLGTKTLYPTPADKLSPVPSGYTPAFINYVGRHGARHLTKEVKSEFAYKLLSRADSAGNLTSEGKRLWKMINALQEIEKGHTKFISAEGRDELSGIGKRMAAQYGQLFIDNAKLNITVTKEGRTTQSAGAFLKGLSANNKRFSQSGPTADDVDLRFFDASPAYDKFLESDAVGKLQDDLAKQLRLAELAKAFTEKIFRPAFNGKIPEDDQFYLVNDVFGYVTIVYGLQQEIRDAGMTFAELDFSSFFTCDHLEALSEFSSAAEDLKKGPALDLNGIQVRVAVPLLVNFIKTSDEFTATGHYVAQLRFAHAETIAPFAALLSLDVADKTASGAANIKKVWMASKVMGMGANIEWIFYQKQGGGDYLVKILHNEREVHVDGLKTVSYPYYHWSGLRAFYMRKLARLGVKLDDDMVKYLSELK
jgi:hypothetical protein